MSNVEIDQGSKMENLTADTVLALSNDVQRAIRIPAAVKRSLFQRLKQKGKSRARAAILPFSAALFLLLKVTSAPTRVGNVSRPRTG